MSRQRVKPCRTLLFAGPRRIELREMSVPAPGPEQVRIETLHSGISRGTEMTLYRGTSPFLTMSYDFDSKLFRIADKPMWAYPLEFGYENVGRVVEIGEQVTRYEVGNIVFTPMPHTESFVMSTVEKGPFFGDLVPILKLPPDLDPQCGVFTALTGVAYNALLDGALLLGETVVVFGAGVIGLLVVQLARLGGAEQIIVVDPISSRRELAGRFGATQLFDPERPDDVSASIRALTSGRGADLAIEVSGSAAGLHEAIRSVGYNGRVVVSSYLAGTGEKLRLGEEFHHNRVRLISSQAFGVAPEVSDRWSPARRTLTALSLLPKLKLEPMITHRFRFADAAKAFELIDTQPEQALQIILDYGAGPPRA